MMMKIYDSSVLLTATATPWCSELFKYLPFESWRSKLAPISTSFVAVSLLPFWIVRWRAVLKYHQKQLIEKCWSEFWKSMYLPLESWRSRFAQNSINFSTNWLCPFSIATWRTVLWFHQTQCIFKKIDYGNFCYDIWTNFNNETFWEMNSGKDFSWPICFSFWSLSVFCLLTTSALNSYYSWPAHRVEPQ